MLSDENRVAAPRGLFSILRRFGGSESFLDEIPGVIEEECDAFPFKIVSVPRVQMKAAPEIRLLQPRQNFLRSRHTLNLLTASLPFL